MTTSVDSTTSQQYRDYITQQSTVKDSSSDFSIDDFYQLLAAQLSNQDMYNAQDDTKFLEQMVQIYNIQNMKEMANVMSEMNTMTMTSYAFEFMGKDVTVATLDSKGEVVQITGKVEKVVLYNGDPQVYVNGQAYSLGNVMEVYSGNSTETDDEEKEEIVEKNNAANSVSEDVADSDEATVDEITTEVAADATTPTEENTEA